MQYFIGTLLNTRDSARIIASGYKNICSINQHFFAMPEIEQRSRQTFRMQNNK